MARKLTREDAGILRHIQQTENPQEPVRELSGLRLENRLLTQTIACYRREANRWRQSAETRQMPTREMTR